MKNVDKYYLYCGCYIFDYVFPQFVGISSKIELIILFYLPMAIVAKYVTYEGS